jgi:hypothetical protein
MLRVEIKNEGDNDGIFERQGGSVYRGEDLPIIPAFLCRQASCQANYRRHVRDAMGRKA